MTEYLQEIKDRLADILRAKRKSTQVVGWYAHSTEVRGPFCRWITPSKVLPEYEKHVADIADECEYIALAMNEIPNLAKTTANLIKVIELQDRALALEPKESPDEVVGLNELKCWYFQEWERIFKLKKQARLNAAKLLEEK